MLEQMRRSSRSLLIYLLFGIVIAVFVVNFGPQSAGGCDAPAASASQAARVEGREITANDFRYGYLMVGGGQEPAERARARRLKETIMDKLIERELLAREAERLGFRVSEEQVEDMLLESKVITLGFEQTLGIAQKDGKFDYELFRRFVQYQLGMSPRAFIEQQRRELMAARVREVLRAGVNVSLDEVKADFLRRNDQANVEFVRVPLARFEAELELGPQEIDAYAQANEEALKKTYEERKFLYEKAPKERRLRQIVLKLDPGASEDAEQAARKKAEALAARIKKGEAFAAVAKATSEDSYSRPRGGDLGWRRQGTTALGAALEQKVWEAKDGEVIGPEKGSDGFYLVLAEGTREGDLSFDQVKRELAEDQLRREKAKERAKAAAEAALARAKAAPDKSLKDALAAAAEPAKAKTARPAAASTVALEDLSVEETGPFSRQGVIVPVIGPSPELAKAIFELKTEEPFAGPVEVGGSFVVVKLKERKTPDLAEFDKKKLELLHEATMVKGFEVVQEWALRRCVEARDAKKIAVNKELLRYEAGPEGAVAYEPCTPPLRF